MPTTNDGIARPFPSRAPQSSHFNQHIGFLDSIRGVAIIAVFLFHLLGAVAGVSHLQWSSWFPKLDAPRSFWFLLPLSFGWCGVPIFFVVSGFCIHLSFIRKPDWKTFFSRRFFRIYPAYLFAVLLFALFIPWTHIRFSFSGLIQLGTHLALIHNFDSRTFYGINVALWSIAVEAQLYFLYPLLILIVSRFGWKQALYSLAALEIGIRAIASYQLMRFGEPPYWLTGIPFTYWFSWTLGAAIADAHTAVRALPFADHSPWGWTVLAVLSWWVKPISPFSFMFFSLATATVIAKLLSRQNIPIPTTVFISRHIKEVGLLSFSIYLLHAPFLYDAGGPAIASFLVQKLHLVFIPSSVVTLIVCLLLWIPIIGFARFSYQYIEVPGIELGRRLFRR